MARHTANKMPEMAAGALHRKGLRDVPPPPAKEIPPHPRRGSRVLLFASVTVFLVWLCILAWLAFS